MERCFKWGTPGQCPGAYLIYIIYKDLPEVVNSIVKIFADDTKIYNKDSNSDIIQLNLDALYSWANMAVEI